MRGWGIRLQVLVLALVPTLSISVALIAYFTTTRIEDLERVFRERGEAIALRLAPAATHGVYYQNQGELENLAKTALMEYGVKGIVFYNKSGEILAKSGSISNTSPLLSTSNTLNLSNNTSNIATEFSVPSKLSSAYPAYAPIIKEEQNFLSLTLPVIHYQKSTMNQKKIKDKENVQDNIVGWMTVELDNQAIHIREYQVLIHTSMLLLLGLSISGLIALQMGRNVTRPILELAQVVERIKHGDLSTRVPISNYRELFVLESGINTMALALQDAQNELQNEVNQATANLRRSLETIEVQNLELEIARQAAEANSQIKSEFLANMSHEIRTPLNGVVGFTNLLKRTSLNEVQQDYVNTIQKSSKTLLSIINDILDFSKIEAGKLNIQRQVMNIRECVEETLTLLAPYSAEKGLVLVPLVYSNVPQLVLGDPLRIKQVITNLVNNAIKFTEHGSVIVRVTVDSEAEAQSIIRIAVIDTGVGLTEKEQQELFQAFHQVNLNLSQKTGGTGLGLVICKKLVEQMKGEIGLESQLGKGSTFWFTFEVDKVSQVPKAETAALSSVQESYASEIHILAVDDNPDNLRLITLLLQELGINVTAASSGQEALDAVFTHSFHLIFMDIRMPGMNGIKATQFIREHEQKNGKLPTPIVALTAHALISEQEALLAAGVDDYLTKPIEEDQLKILSING